MKTFYTKNMLAHYGKQLVSARRLARYENLIGRQMPPEDAASFRRKAMVERITQEIVENLIVSGSENPIVEEVRQTLEKKLGYTIEFHYPPGSLDYRIYSRGPQGEREELTGPAKDEFMLTLWNVTLETVNATML